LDQLERRRGLRLFDRAPSRYVPTEAGRKMVMAAERLEAAMMELDRSISGRDAHSDRDAQPAAASITRQPEPDDPAERDGDPEETDKRRGFAEDRYADDD